MCKFLSKKSVNPRNKTNFGTKNRFCIVLFLIQQYSWVWKKSRMCFEWALLVCECLIVFYIFVQNLNFKKKSIGGSLSRQTSDFFRAFFQPLLIWKIFLKLTSKKRISKKSRKSKYADLHFLLLCVFFEVF